MIQELIQRPFFQIEMQLLLCLGAMLTFTLMLLVLSYISKRRRSQHKMQKLVSIDDTEQIQEIA
ncbi:MAG: hypothetical protein WC886_08595 [Saccharofermentanaceae bacterium]|nr:hypothetical protein [Clostridia bacterium]NLX68939.1 hypothetical protein [Clostridiaceae bacterium]HOO48827.1 hypothetical protein [Saccharofermentans sp.]HPE27456.1 hypothetical protein [Saccharofermentans sp.]HRV51275.1 hypothetical protein [Saccharofermentans sp.]